MGKLYAIVAADFIPHGGMDRPNFELAWHLAERVKAELHLVSHRVASPLADHPMVTWHRVRRPLSRDTLGSPFLDAAGKRVAARIAGRGGTVLVNGGNCIWNDVNWIHYVHNTAMAEPRSPSAFYRAWIGFKRQRDRRRERLSVTGSRLVITDSQLMKRLLTEAVAIDPARVRTVYYGIDPEAFRPVTETERSDARRQLGLAPDRPMVAFVGAIAHNRRKGFDVLFDAWGMCHSRTNWDVCLVVAGTGPELPYWRARAHEAGWGDDIRFLGYTKQVDSLLRAADALVAPTRFEPYGQGVHEAICCGLPTFVTRCAGIAERFPAELDELLLDAPPAADQLAERLLAWRGDIEGYRRRLVPFSDQLRSRNWTDMAAEMVAAIESA
jgi:glycosyltransferase involved in cell wall biosynthesis